MNKQRVRMLRAVEQKLGKKLSRADKRKVLSRIGKLGNNALERIVEERGIAQKPKLRTRVLDWLKRIKGLEPNAKFGLSHYTVSIVLIPALLSVSMVHSSVPKRELELIPIDLELPKQEFVLPFEKAPKNSGGELYIRALVPSDFEPVGEIRNLEESNDLNPLSMPKRKKRNEQGVMEPAIVRDEMGEILQRLQG